MTFENVLPTLATSYRKGELVPFIGAGMSRPACVGWKDFIVALEREALEAGMSRPAFVGRKDFIVALERNALESKATNDDTKDEDPKEKDLREHHLAADLVRRADVAVKRLLIHGEVKFQDACRHALTCGPNPVLPPQSEALGKTVWPLVLTTNYDDWYASACSGRPLLILGRGARDCEQVLASMTRRMRPILWALQGFLGGQAPNAKSQAPDLKRTELNDKSQAPDLKRTELAEQVVVGHHHYQKVMSKEPHFRRALADVFRRRSFLFVGSGLTDDYFVNLFSQILLEYGHGSLPHYALLKEDEAELQRDLLQSRLNITPIIYDRHDDLPDILSTLTKACSKESLKTARSSRLEEHYLLCAKSPARLVLRWGPLPKPEGGWCTALSAGMNDNGNLLFGNQAQTFRSDHFGNGNQEELRTKLSDSLYVLGNEDSVFAVIARANKDGERDLRDLRAISSSFRELLHHLSGLGKAGVHVGLISAGPGRKWDPAFSLVEMLRGARIGAEELRKGNKKCPSVTIHIVDPSVWYPLLARTIDVEDILSSPLIKFWAESRPVKGEGTGLLCIRQDNETVASVANLLGFLQGQPQLESWHVEVHPQPTSGDPPSAKEAWDMPLYELGVVHGSTLLFCEKPKVMAVASEDAGADQ